MRLRQGSTPTPFQYVGTAGYYFDTSALTYVRARVLNTVLGRWMTKDPLGLGGGDYNQSRYVLSRPSALTDRTGMTLWLCYRDVVPLPGFDCQFFDHWFLLTTQCGCVGWGPDGVMWGRAKNLGGQTAQCTQLSFGAEVESCICSNAANVSRGWKMCGKFWNKGQNYHWWLKNCQTFVDCLLSECTGGAFGWESCGGPIGHLLTGSPRGGAAAEPLLETTQ